MRTAKRYTGSLLIAIVMGAMFTQATVMDTVKQCPEVCKGLDSGDWSYWFLGCWEFGSVCSSALEAPAQTVKPVYLMSKLRMR